MTEALSALERGEAPKDLVAFGELRERVGFDAYDTDLRRYQGK